MKLLGVEKRDNSLYSEWNLTYRVGWEKICTAVQLIYHYTRDPELITGDAGGGSRISVKDEKEIPSLSM